MKKIVLKGKAFFTLVDKMIESEYAELIAGRYDFVPIVKLNTDHDDAMEKANAIWSTKSCKDFKKTILPLSDSFDKSLRKYTIPEIIIAKNSKSLIPLENILGYDPWGPQDKDGILEFKPSKAITIKVLDEECPDDVDEKTEKYDLKKAKVGNEYCLQISHKLGRGEKFSIEVFAQDEDEDNQKDKKLKCGKLNFTVVQRDIFLSDERKKVINENKKLVKKDTVCFRVADKQLAKLFNNESLNLENKYFGENSYSRMEKYKSLGYVKEEKIFDQFIYKGGGNYEPKKFDSKKFGSGIEKIFYNYFKKVINNKIGFHIFYFSVVKGNHVLTLIIDSRETFNRKFQVYDQIRTRPEDKLENIDKEMLRLTNSIWKYVLGKTGARANTETAIWKIQRR